MPPLWGGSEYGGNGSLGPGMDTGPDPDAISCAEIQAAIASFHSTLENFFESSKAVRKEMQGYLRPLTQSDGSVAWSWLPVTQYSYQSGCRAIGRIPGPIYGGTFYVHTHPFEHNDLVSIVTSGDPDCSGYGKYLDYQPGIGADAQHLAQMRASGRLPGLRAIGLMVDGSGVVAFNADAENQRCYNW